MNLLIKAVTNQKNSFFGSLIPNHRSETMCERDKLMTCLPFLAFFGLWLGVVINRRFSTPLVEKAYMSLRLS